MSSIFEDDSLPVGFGMALGMNMNAMKRFSNMTEAEKEELLNRARDAKSRDEMSGIVAELDGERLK